MDKNNRHSTREEAFDEKGNLRVRQLSDKELDDIGKP
jgi:hypothetical protein